MSDLHDARVEEIAKVMADMNGEPRPGRYERTLATVALKNADAAVTVEMIAAALHGDECPDDPDEGEACNCDGNHYMRQGEIVLALIRGETETSE